VGCQAVVEPRIVEAHRSGALEDLAGHGLPIPDFDRRRSDGW